MNAEHFLVKLFSPLKSLFGLEDLSSKDIKIYRSKGCNKKITWLKKNEVKLLKKCWVFPLQDHRSGCAIIPFLHSVDN